MTAPPLMADWSDPGETVIAGAGLAAFAFYVGGNTPHAWDRNQVGRQTLRYAAPIWTYGLAGGRSGGLTEGPQAVAALREHGVPSTSSGGPVAIWVDMEGHVDVSYLDGFRAAIGPYWHGVYGQASTVFANPAGGAGYWVADWTGHPFEYPHKNVSATQYEDAAMAGTPWDWSELATLSHLWDRQAQPVADGYLVVAGGAGAFAGRAVTSSDGGKTWS